MVKTEKTALEAKFEAQKIAFGPIVFQATRALRELGVLSILHAHRKQGLTIELLAEESKISLYGIKVLLEVALSADIVSIDEGGNYTLTKTGYFLIKDELTTVNFNFVNDVCYSGMFHLPEAIQTGRPAGLKSFGDWQTIYEALSHLPPHVQKSWFDFDHFYSDRAFSYVLPLLFAKPIRRLVDIGGNTGRFALRCVDYDPDVRITILDLPGQLAKARHNIQEQGHTARIEGVALDLLKDEIHLPPDTEIVWMSQFLDCFSESQVIDILTRLKRAMHPGVSIYILETLWDRQRFQAASYSLTNTSLYFTCMANGCSKMYHSSELHAYIEKAGLSIKRELDNIGLDHTLIEVVNC